MKNIYTSVIAMTLLSGTAMAQQLPNADFEGAWVDCIPWNSANTTDVQGGKPEHWCISNVVTPGMSAGNQTVGEKVEGNGSASAVRVFNKSVVGQVIPGYLTLGTTWATAKVRGTTPSNADGGTWGGIDFVYRPDAIQFDYTHSNGSKSSEPATMALYSWKGQTTQADVPAQNTFNLIFTPADPAKVDMVNRDRNILGLETAQGGDVTRSADFEKIAATIYSITTVTDQWTTIEVPIEYFSTATPEKINVVFSAGDYFADRGNLKGDDELSIDNVKFIYYSRLASLKINGVDIEGFVSDKYDYTVDADAMPAAEQIAAACMGNSGTAKATVEINAEAKTATVTVSNAQGADADGQASHVYTIHFNIPEKATIVSTKKFTGLLTVDLGDDPAEVPDTEVELREYSDGTYGMYLADFAGMGAIELNGMKLEGEALTGRVEGLALSGGAIQANVDLTGTYDGTDLELHLDIDAYAPVELPVKVDFTTKVSQGPKVVDSRDFIGLLRVDLGDGAEDMDNTTVTLNKFDDGTYGMYLSDFAGMGAIELNGIALNGTQMSGYVPGFSLAGGEIQANVTLTGNYEGSNLELHLDIAAYAPVELPVKVDFYSPASLGAIGEIASDNAAPAEYYNLQGIRVSASELTPGIYVCRKGNEVKKVLVK